MILTIIEFNFDLFCMVTYHNYLWKSKIIIKNHENCWIRWAMSCVFPSVPHSLNHILAGEYIGLEEIDDGIWEVYYGLIWLGRLDERFIKIVDESMYPAPARHRELRRGGRASILAWRGMWLHYPKQMKKETPKFNPVCPRCLRLAS